MSQVWNDYWSREPARRPAEEPASRFVLARMMSAFGRIRGLRVVEIGAGRGDISFLLALKGADVTLVDSSSLVLSQARSIFSAAGLSAEYVTLDILADELDRTFDVAMSFGLVEHFVGEERRKAIRAHRAGAIGFIAVPNAFCVPYRLWKIGKELTGTWPYGREAPMTRASLAREMEAWFKDVSTFTTPLSYSLRRHLGHAPPFADRMDRWFGYQIIGTGIAKDQVAGGDSTRHFSEHPLVLGRDALE